jgi:hypothetical protein
MSVPYKNNLLSANDREISLDKKNNLLSNLKKGPKLLYNTTVGELKNGRIPILDSAYRTVYRKSFNPDNSKGRDVFQKSEGYYRLGGRMHISRRKRKTKTYKRSKSMKNKSRKNKK